MTSIASTKEMAVRLVGLGTLLLGLIGCSSASSNKPAIRPASPPPFMLGVSEPRGLSPAMCPARLDDPATASTTTAEKTINVGYEVSSPKKAAPVVRVAVAGQGEPVEDDSPPVKGDRALPAEDIVSGMETTREPEHREMFPIDLPTALHLADTENLQVALAREQIRQAWAYQQSAEALWLPSLRAGLNYNKHEGKIQDVAGNNIEVSRGALYTGIGAGAVGAGSPAVPGVYASFHLADALFRPLAARQFAQSRRYAAAATTNDVLLNVALAYLELLRAAQEQSIADEAQTHAEQLTRLTEAYAASGEGLESDADRARVELALRRNEVQRSRESVEVASARLAQLLRLSPTLLLTPVESNVVPVELVPSDVPLAELIAQALTSRPELSENRMLVAEAAQRLRREQMAPLVPSLVMGTSYGGFGAGVGDSLAGFSDRFDFDAMAYWEVRNLGAGDRAAQAAARSQIHQACLRSFTTMDLVAREVGEAHAQSQSRQQQIKTAQAGVESALSSYRRNVDRIQGGQGLPIEVLQSIQALAQARREYLRAVIGYNTAQFSLERALGWSPRQ